MILKNKNLKISRKIAIQSVFSILLLGLISFFVIFKTVNDIKIIGKEIVDEQISIEQRLYEDRNKMMIQNKLSKIEPLTGVLDTIFVDKSRAIEFFTSLEEAAKNNGITQTISLSEVSEEKNKSFFTNTPISIKSEGEYRNLLIYLTELEKLNYYFNIESLSINKSPSPRRTVNSAGEVLFEPILNMNITAQTYWKN